MFIMQVLITGFPAIFLANQLYKIGGHVPLLSGPTVYSLFVIKVNRVLMECKYGGTISQDNIAG